MLFDFTDETENSSIVDNTTGEFVKQKTEYTPKEMTNEMYHSSTSLSKSSLDMILQSPYHFKYPKVFKKDSPALIIGSATHKMVLEPDTFWEEFYTDDIIKGTTINKQHLKKEMYKQVKSMAESVLHIKESSIFLNNGVAEHSYFSEIDGVPVRCRPDYYNEELGIIVDLKTTEDASPVGFQQSIGKWNYHIQVAFYTDVMKSLGKKVNAFLFIAVEKKDPHLVGFYNLDDPSIDRGREKYKEALELYKYCVVTDNWWSYSNFNPVTKELNPIQTLTIPAWKFYN